MDLRKFPRHVILRELEAKPYLVHTLKPEDMIWLGLQRPNPIGGSIKPGEGSANILHFPPVKPPEAMGKHT